MSPAFFVDTAFPKKDKPVCRVKKQSASRSSKRRLKKCHAPWTVRYAFNEFFRSGRKSRLILDGHPKLKNATTSCF